MSEIRALLLTDVVDSTKLAESIGDTAMAQVWAAHDRIARDLLQRHHGHEIDKTDGMLMLFETAADAVGFTTEYHPALAAMSVPLRARAGIHVGPVLLRENSSQDIALGAKPLEVEGLAKPTAARVMSLARGGQTLLTAEAREQLGKTTLKIESHGHWMVKGVADPIEIFEVGDAVTRFVAPEDTEKVYRVVRAAEWWMPLRDIPHNLPNQTTSFVGRDGELAEVKALLEKVRLVTLLGMGGLGKTRLCLQAAAELIHRFHDGVWFIDLSTLREEALVVAEAVQILGVKADPGRTPLQSLCAHLRSQRALLILDNCEHLVKPAAELALAMLRAAPHVRIIASSREALHVPGEQSFPLRPLPLPGRDASVTQLAASPAVQLFCDRARQNKPTFTLDAEQAPAVAELVARLEGIPLALELAAARVRSLTVAEINSRLKDRYKILTGGARVLQERQQTLRALVDWSYDLLNPQERALFARLGVFVGGFDLAAAEVICSAEPLSAEDILDVLASLVDKSLVMLDEHDGSGRYRMLETIREYAHERLQERGELEPNERRHCEHFFALAKQARDGMLGHEQGEWIQRLEADLDNVRAAMKASIAGHIDPIIAVKLAVALQQFWSLRGYSTEGRRFLGTALELPAIQESDLAQAWALYVGAVLAEAQSDHAEALRMLEKCLQLRRRLGNPVDIAATLSTLSLARLQGGDVTGATACEEEALGLFRQLSDRSGEMIGLLHVGQIALYADHSDWARTNLESALAIARDLKQQEVEGESELLLGEVAFESADIEKSELWFKRSLTVCREAGDRRGEANALRSLGRCDLFNGDLVTARSRLIPALQAYKSSEMWEELFSCLEDFARLRRAEGEADAAVRLLASTAAARQRLALVHPPRAARAIQSLTEELRRALGSDRFRAGWSEGSAWDVEEAVRVARTIESEARFPA